MGPQGFAPKIVGYLPYSLLLDFLGRPYTRMMTALLSGVVSGFRQRFEARPLTTMSRMSK